MSVLFIKINNFMCNNSFFSFMNEQKELLLQNGQFIRGEKRSVSICGRSENE